MWGHGLFQGGPGAVTRNSGLLTAASRRACSLNLRQALHTKPNLAPLSLAGLFLWPGCAKMQRACGLVNAANSPFAAVDGEVRSVLVDPAPRPSGAAEGIRTS